MRELKEKDIKVIMLVVGNLLIGIGIALFKVIGLGTDPFSAMNIGISNNINFSLGTYQMIVNIILFIILLSFIREKIGIGTFINMLLLGYVIQFSSEIYNLIFTSPNNILLKVFLLLIGMIILVMGLSLYVTADLGIAPYDAISIYLSEKTKVNFGLCRAGTDITCAIVAIIAGGPIGVTTVIIAFGLGPLVQITNKNFSEKLLEKYSEEEVL